MDHPTRHQLRAALRVARIIDTAGNATVDVRTSYLHLPTLGEHRQADLQLGETLLLRAGVLVQEGDRIVPGVSLEVVARVDDETALAVLNDLLPSAIPDDDLDLRALVGAAGEKAVAAACRDELITLGAPNLADYVQRVSLVDDRLGYDVSAPCLRTPPRMLEVKTSGVMSMEIFRFIITRNEYEVGRRHVGRWSLVACIAGRTVESAEAAKVLGWCASATLQPYLPSDAGGRWTEALVLLPSTLLRPGIPSAV